MRQICVYAQPTARISPLIAQINQKLVRPAMRNANPRTYSRLVPQSPKSIAPAANQPTFRGRSPDSIASAGGSERTSWPWPPPSAPPLGDGVAPLAAADEL